MMVSVLFALTQVMPQVAQHLCTDTTKRALPAGFGWQQGFTTAYGGTKGPGYFCQHKAGCQIKL